MLRLRDKTGKSYKLSADVRFIEVCDRDGAPAAIIQVESPTVANMLTPGDPEFAQYIKTYKLKKAELRYEKEV